MPRIPCVDPDSVSPGTARVLEAMPDSGRRNGLRDNGTSLSGTAEVVGVGSYSALALRYKRRAGGSH